MTKVDYSFEKQVNMLVSYIQEEQKRNDNGWVIITHRDVPRITGYSQYYTNRAFEALKNHPLVAHRIADIKKPNKPFEYKVCSAYEEKKKLTLENAQFRYLTKEEIEKIKNMLDKEVDNFEDLILHIRVLDYLCLLGIKEKPVDFNIKKISNIFVITKNKTEEILINLLDSEILDDKGDVYSLSIISDNISCKSHQGSTNNDKKTPLLPVEKDDKIENEIKNKQESSNTGKGGGDSSVEEIVESIRSMTNIQEEFKQFLDSKVSEIVESEKGYKALQRAAEDDQKKRERIAELEEENRLLQRSLEKKNDEKEEFISEVQSRLEVLMAEVTNIVSNYVKIPAWQKDQQTNARFQNNILGAVTAAVDDILERK